MDESKVIELYQKYDTCRQVAEVLGTNNEAVRRVLIKHGIKRTGNRPSKQRKTDKRMPSNCRTTYCGALVVMLRENLGLPTGHISAETGIPTGSVVNILNRKRPDLKMRRCQRLKDETIAAIERDYMTEASAREIGEKYGIKESTVTYLMRKRGHVRGKGGGAVRAANIARRNRAIAKILSECGNIDNADVLNSESRREILMSCRKRDYGITWKALAKHNGSMKCEVCGVECNPDDKAWGSFGPTHPSVDHIVRICDGGEDTWENTRLACMKCNLKLNADANKTCTEVCA